MPDGVVPVQNLFSAVANAETGAFKDPFIRTVANKVPGGSSAYGPLQVTGTLASDYLNRFRNLFDHNEVDYLKKFTNQAGLFLRHGNMKGKLPDYNPAFDYGGSGILNSPQDKSMYTNVFNKVLGHSYTNRAGGNLNNFLDMWRGKLEPSYNNKVMQQLNKRSSENFESKEIMRKEAIMKGFIKAASQAGLTEGEAIDLFKYSAGPIGSLMGVHAGNIVGNQDKGQLK